ncbi:MAG TPA: hypothetical protein VGA70_10645 [Longimicrobiales bacterium]|jgi:hypothetical protein
MRRLLPAPARVLAGLVLLGASGVSARQEAPDSAPAPTPTPGGWAAYAAVPHPWSTVVAVTVALPVGSADDPRGQGGTAWLVGESVAAGVRDRFSGRPLHVDVRVERSGTVYRVVTLEEIWPEALDVLEAALFGGEFEAPGFAGAKAALEASLTFESGSPVRDFKRELYTLLSTAGDPWARDPRGTLDTVVPLGAAEVILFRAQHYRMSQAALTVTGAVDPVAVSRRVSGASPAEPDGTAPVVAAREHEAFTAPAWETGDRLRLAPEVTSSWIGVAFPVRPGTDLTALELFIHRVREELVTDPPAPGLFSAEIGLVFRGDRPIFLVEAAVTPDVTDEWEARILRTAHVLSAEILADEFFGWHRRRFRAARLMEEMAPEDEGVRLALDLLRNGRIRDLPGEIDALEPADMARAAGALGSPRILVFGPDLDGRLPVT